MFIKIILTENFINNLINNPNSSRISLSSFVLAIFLSFTLSFILSRVYKKQSNTFSNPESLARILPLLSVGTTLIIVVVKSSLALSLGLVGALSIVRFRTPIKEPEELTYIFLSIGIGLATGADQYKVAVIGLLLTIGCIYLNKKFNTGNISQNSITISISSIKNGDINEIIALITNNSKFVNFHNLSSTNQEDFKNTSITLSFTPNNFEDINLVFNQINNVFPKASINILDNNNF